MEKLIGSEEQVKLAEDIRKEMIKLTNFAISRSKMPDAIECYETALKKINEIKNAKVFIVNFKEFVHEDRSNLELSGVIVMLGTDKYEWYCTDEDPDRWDGKEPEMCSKRCASVRRGHPSFARFTGKEFDEQYSWSY